MSTPTGLSYPTQRINSADVEGFDSLSELALDLRSAWNHASDEIWRQLDPALWEFTHNPWVVLQTVSRKKLQLCLS
jgi:starch phosphorylase